MTRMSWKQIHAIFAVCCSWAYGWVDWFDDVDREGLDRDVVFMKEEWGNWRRLVRFCQDDDGLYDMEPLLEYFEDVGSRDDIKWFTERFGEHNATGAFVLQQKLSGATITASITTGACAFVCQRSDGQELMSVSLAFDDTSHSAVLFADESLPEREFAPMFTVVSDVIGASESFFLFAPNVARIQRAA